MAKKQKNKSVNTTVLGQIKILIQITRPLNILMVAIGVLIAILVGIGKLAPIDITIPAVLAAACISAGGNSLNDYYDRFIDTINKPDRPLPSGKITSAGVWTFSLFLFVLGIGFSLLLPWLCIVIALVNSFLLVLYAIRLKKSGFFGNILISYLVASIFAFGAAAVNALVIGIFLSIVAFFTNAARELLKDMEDIKGDEMFGAKTLPMLEGRQKSKIVVSSFLVISILVSPLPYFLEILSLYYLILAIFADGIFATVIYSISKSAKNKNIKINSQRIKIGAIIGLIAFLAGTVPSFIII
jgi:geranylgeranylglycerol-phosphate geranylgeranyltransferase